VLGVFDEIGSDDRLINKKTTQDKIRSSSPLSFPSIKSFGACQLLRSTGELLLSNNIHYAIICDMIGRITLPQHLRNSIGWCCNGIIPVLGERGVGGAITIQLSLRNNNNVFDSYKRDLYQDRKGILIRGLSWFRRCRRNASYSCWIWLGLNNDWVLMISHLRIFDVEPGMTGLCLVVT